MEYVEVTVFCKLAGQPMEGRPCGGRGGRSFLEAGRIWGGAFWEREGEVLGEVGA